MRTSGRGSRTVSGSRRSTPNGSVFSSTPIRGLRPHELGGVIFMCSKASMGECLSKKLFGAPINPSWSYVRNIRKGMRLFLYNHSERRMHGGFKADCEGRKNIDPTAWNTNGVGTSSYGAQVKVCEERKCNPISEEVFHEHFSCELYIHFPEPRHFMFELTHGEAEKLDSLFESVSTPPADRFSGRDIENASRAWQKALRKGLPSITSVDEASGLGTSFSSLLLEPKFGSFGESEACVVVKEEKAKSVQDPLMRELRFQAQGVDVTSVGIILPAPEPNLEVKNDPSGMSARVGVPRQELRAANAEPRMVFNGVQNTGNIEDLDVKSGEDKVLGNTKNNTLLFLEGDDSSLLQVGVFNAGIGVAGIGVAGSLETEPKTKSLPNVEWEKLHQILSTDDGSLSITSTESLRICAAAILQMQQDILQLKQENQKLKCLLTGQQHGPHTG